MAWESTALEYWASKPPPTLMNFQRYAAEKS